MRRSGFTILEVLLASAIAVILMGALYTALDIQTRTVQEGRTAIDQANLARAVLNRMSLDITSALAPITATASASSSSTTVDSSTTTPVTPFNLGMTGDNASFSVTMSRLPVIARGQGDMPETQQQSSCDIHRVSYWIAQSGDGGLARQDESRVSADSTEADDGKSEADRVIAVEVRSLSVQYFDGTAWQDSWDGSTPGSDEVTPIGPPRAIAITVGIRPIGATDDSTLKYYRHVVAIESANGIATAPVTEDTP